MTVMFEILSKGGSVGLAAITLAMWYLERKERRETTAQLYDLAQASIQSVAKTETAIESLNKTLDRYIERP